MRWPFSHPKPRGEPPGPTRLESGVHRAPGLATLCDGLAGEKARSVLDFGPSSTENVEFLSRLVERVQIQDLFRSCGGTYGARAEIYRFPAVERIALPEDGPYDAILLWDLLHYFEPSQIPPLVARLGRLSRPGSRVLLIASAKVPIPPTPVQFKIAGRDRLVYRVATDQRLPPPQLTPRQIEKLFRGFAPLRLFQLRNGLQELLFVYRGEDPEQQPSTFARGSTGGSRDLPAGGRLP